LVPEGNVRTERNVSPTKGNRRRSLGVAIVVVAVGLLFTAVLAVGSREHSGGDGTPVPAVVGSGPGYASVEALTSDSDLVVVAHPVDEIGREVDRGGDPSVDPVSGEPIPGIPMVIAAVEIDEVLVARASPPPAAGATIPVAYPEASHLPLGSIEPGRPSLLPEGTSFVLFLEHLDRSTAPGITLVDDFYVPQGGLAGVFDIVGDTAVGLGPVGALRTTDRPPSSDREAPQRLSVPLNDLLAVVRSSTATP